MPITEVGEKIRELRKARGLTLEQLAQLSGLSRSFISEAERGFSSMTLTSLKRIAEALGVTLADFFQPPTTSDSPRIVRAQERKEFRLDDTGHIYLCSLGGQLPDKRMEPILSTMPPTTTEVTPHSHPGEEFVMVLEGTLTVIYDTEEFELGPGDSIHMISTVPHAWVNRTDKTIHILSVNTPPLL